MLIFKIGIRNVIRNKKRSILAALAIGLGLASLIIADAFLVGLNVNMIKEATGTLLGDAQIQREGFRETFEIEKTINSLDDVVQKLIQDERIDHFSKRIQATAMISSPANVNNVALYGIDPEKEKDVSKIKRAIIRGNYLDKYKSNEKKILIGKNLAKRLQVDVGEKVVITVAQARSGELSQELFRVSGIFSFRSKDMDTAFAFVHINLAEKILDLNNEAHEIVLKFKSLDEAGNLESSFWKKFSYDGNKALSWKKVIPTLDAAISMTDISMMILAVILYTLVAMGIVNVLFMSIYERFYEFGVLKAIGTRPYKLALMIISEAITLGFLSVIMGVILTFVLGGYMAVYGIDYSGIEYATVTFTEPIKAVLQLRQFVVFPITTLIFTTVISIYPAIFAARITPARAMKRTL